MITLLPKEKEEKEDDYTSAQRIRRKRRSLHFYPSKKKKTEGKKHACTKDWIWYKDFQYWDIYIRNNIFNIGAFIFDIYRKHRLILIKRLNKIKFFIFRAGHIPLCNRSIALRSWANLHFGSDGAPWGKERSALSELTKSNFERSALWVI